MAIETRSIRILRLQSALGSTQHDIDVDCVERKDDQAGFGLLQDTSFYQCMDIAMDAFYVAFDPARRLSDRERPCPCHRPDQFPAFGGQKPEQQFRAGKANPRTLLSAFERILHTTLNILEGCDFECHSFHFNLSMLRRSSRNQLTALSRDKISRL
jgi:hypothetical protein